jgi:hypothetical protein
LNRQDARFAKERERKGGEKKREIQGAIPREIAANLQKHKPLILSLPSLPPWRTWRLGGSILRFNPPNFTQPRLGMLKYPDLSGEYPGAS